MMKKSKKLKVVGIIGKIASGKGTAADFFVKKYKFKQITMSNFLRKEAEKRHRHPSREYLRKLQAELRKQFGQNVLVNMAIDLINENKEKYNGFVIDGLRDYREAKYAQKKLRLKIILIQASPLTRFKRAKARHRKGFDKTYEQFLYDDSMETAIFDFNKTEKLADFIVSSEQGKEFMYKDLGKIAKKLGF
jgi:dephospho-CoA kinase